MQTSYFCFFYQNYCDATRDLLSLCNFPPFLIIILLANFDFSSSCNVFVCVNFQIGFSSVSKFIAIIKVLLLSQNTVVQWGLLTFKCTLKVLEGVHWVPRIWIKIRKKRLCCRNVLKSQIGSYLSTLLSFLGRERKTCQPFPIILNYLVIIPYPENKFLAYGCLENSCFTCLHILRHLSDQLIFKYSLNVVS